MKNMAFTKADKKKDKESACGYIASESKYPYGLCVRLDNTSIEKLGMKTLPEVKDEMLLTARVVVTSVTSNEREGRGPEKTVELQITNMSLDEDGEMSAMNRGIRDGSR